MAFVIEAFSNYGKNYNLFTQFVNNLDIILP